MGIRRRKGTPVLFLLLVLLIDNSYSMMQDLYCEEANCYDVLSVNRMSTKSEISKAYRHLARLYHPDKHMDPDDKVEAEEKFKSIATAYEVLKDEDSRADYDYMLDHPEEYYRNYYHYYRRKMSVKVDVRIVIVVSITLVSIFQYYAASFRWSSGINYLVRQHKFRQMALEEAEKEGLLNDVKKMKKRNKDEIRAEEERIIRTVLESKMDIKGGYAKPKVTDVIFFQLLFFPRTLYRYLYWYISWTYRFNIKKEEYGKEEKFYLIRKMMGISEIQFERLSDEEKESFMDLELWIPHNYSTWKTDLQEDLKRKNAESSRYKSSRRRFKKLGVSRMRFDDG